MRVVAHHVALRNAGVLEEDLVEARDVKRLASSDSYDAIAPLAFELFQLRFDVSRLHLLRGRAALRLRAALRRLGASLRRGFRSAFRARLHIARRTPCDTALRATSSLGWRAFGRVTLDTLLLEMHVHGILVVSCAQIDRLSQAAVGGPLRELHLDH